ncbi:MAG TPA: TolC family protein [Flavisolibacter sp.]|nr:TolC family protein [Flavisolibacter sp.]
MKKRLRGIVLLSLTVLALNAQAQRHEFTAADAVEYARKNNTQVKNALLDVKIQEQTNREITGSAYPQINGSLNATDYLSIPTNLLPGELAGQPAGTYIPVKFGTKFIQSGGVSLQQILFDGQVFVGLQARKTAIAFSQKNVEVTEENIKTNIYKIYYQLAASDNQLRILDANIERVQKLSNDTKKMFENGFAEKLDISRIDVQLANLRTERQRAQNTINNGYLGLKVLMGMPVNDTLILTEKINEDNIRSGVLDAAAFNYQDRKDYQYAELGKRLNEYNVRRYRLTKIPTVSLNSTFNVTRQSNKFGFGGPWYRTALIGLNVNVPIFDGFARRARIQKAQLQLEQSLNNIEGLKQNIDREVHEAINNYSNALATLNNQKRNMELAEQVYEQTRLKFQNGIGSNTEITSAQSDLQVAQSNYILAIYDAITAKIDFLKATGKLP